MSDGAMCFYCRRYKCECPEELDTTPSLPVEETMVLNADDSHEWVDADNVPEYCICRGLPPKPFCPICNPATYPVAALPPSGEGVDQQEIEPAVKLLADVMHLWVDGYISKSPDSHAPSSISSDTFDEIESFLSTHKISVGYCGWSVEQHLTAEPKAAPLSEGELTRHEWPVGSQVARLQSRVAMLEGLLREYRKTCKHPGYADLCDVCRKTDAALTPQPAPLTEEDSNAE